MAEIQYYFAPQSPWTYLGHLRFWDIARRHGARIEVLPVDLGGKVFPVSGGQPLGKRAPQRQAYRLVELQRFADYLHAPLKLQPKYFPVVGDDAARLIIAVDLFNPTTTIRFTIIKESNVNLSIYNVLGELVSTLVNEQLKTGSHQYEFNASELSSGIYIYRIITDDFVETKKMVLLT